MMKWEGRRRRGDLAKGKVEESWGLRGYRGSDGPALAV